MDKGVSRRAVLQVGGAAVSMATLPLLSAQVANKTKTKRWTAEQLLERGEPEVYSGDELRYIGMPVGGLFAGTVYLGGDGQLWNWDIFNQEHLGCVDRKPALYMGESLNAIGGANYVDPVRQQSPFQQRFKLSVIEANPREVRFGEVRFRGEYPVGRVSYSKADADVEMTLEAFSPFIPLDAERSSYPATTMTFRVTNVGKAAQQFVIAYEVDNPVLVFSKKDRDDFELTGKATPSEGVVFSASAKKEVGPDRTDVLFENWSSGTYGSWKTTGTAFGTGPQRVTNLPSYMGPVNAGTTFVVNSHQTRNGEDVVVADQHVGTLRSPSFTVSRRFINLRVGGGSHQGGTCVNLVVDGKIVRSVTGRQSNVMNWESMNVRELAGKEAYIEVVDSITTGWGQISLGEVIFSDQPGPLPDLSELQDYGSFCVEVVGGADESTAAPEKAVVGRRVKLGPGESKKVTFVVAWHFGNCARNLPGKRHWYAKRWPDAKAVADDIIGHWDDLSRLTLAWNKTWYSSTLPYWFLDRTFINTSILATTTCLRLDEGRYYFWEGVGCCAGTCTHVWGYAQAIGRVFPEVERYLRKEIDFGRAYRKDTGAIDYRAEYHQIVAHDGQASCILRAYREHTMSPNLNFLKSIWPQVKGAMLYLIKQDEDRDGILTGAQYNTLDTAWYGSIAWISSLYLAALRACEKMAVEMGDSEFAKECGSIVKSGSAKLVAELFNGEYFINKADAAHPEANNTRTGCHIDQIYGQSWAHQVGLPRIVPPSEEKKALRSMFKYSFYEDVWEYRRQNREIPGGRWYALPSEAGLIMCSFPHGGGKDSVGKGSDAWAVGYFNECMSGFEYQAANHMISEGLVEEGLRVVHAIHQRYHASKRNPYNEIECSDHYGRAMASFGAYVSITGFQVHGPSHSMSFAPQVHADRYCFAFINEQGWGVVEKQPGAKPKTTYAFRLG